MPDPEIKPIGEETKLLAAMAYGESSASNNADEMSAIASVLIRQRNARGHATMQDFVAKDRTYSYVVGDGNPRYKKMTKATDAEIRQDKGMMMALSAAENALANGPDLSNGAYFWDGADIKTKYKSHFKVRNGIRFSEPAHNVYGIEPSTRLVILKKTVVKRVGKKVTKTQVEAGRYDHVYESTAGLGGTIFWKNSEDYMKTAGAKAYK